MTKIKLFTRVLLMGALGACLVGCGGDSGSEKTGNALIIDKAKNMAVSELIEKAKAETGNFIVYSISSKTDKTVKAFQKVYGLEGEFKAVKQSERDYYGSIEKLISGGSTDIDALVTQNGASLSTQILAGNAINYIPNIDGLDRNANEYAFMYYFKEFSRDKAYDSNKLSNVWDLTDSTRDYSVYYKKSNEPINQLFLAELTTDKWAKELAEAYDAKYGEGKCTEVLIQEKKENAGYLFIDKFLHKVIDYDSESKIASTVVTGAKTETIGFCPVSKYTLGDKGNYNKVSFLNDLQGFKGYAYKFYGEISKTTDRPYTAMLFMNYLATAEGVKNYQTGNGVYSTNPNVQTNLNTLLDGMVLENYNDVKANWANIVALLESYTK